MEKIHRKTYSNSGKTEYNTIYIEGDGIRMILESFDKECYFPDRGKRVFVDKLPINDKEKSAFIAYCMQINTEKEKQHIEQDCMRRKEKEDFDKFLSTIFIDDIKFEDIYEKVIEILHSNGDHSTYSFLNIAVICLATSGLIDIEWTKEYNSYPFLKNESLLKDIEKEYLFYIMKDDRIIFKIKCPDKMTGRYFYEEDFRSFNFKIERIE